VFGPRMYFQTGQVIFVPEWPNGEFVSILASFCVWTKSLVCKDAVLQGIPLFRVMSEGSALFSRQKFSESPSVVWTIVPSRPDAHLSTVPSIQKMCLTVRMPVRPSIIRPDNVHFPFGPLLYREATVPACIRPDDSAACSDTSQ